MADSGRFVLLDVIGCGGHGTVHRARFEGEGGFQKEVAIKLLKASTQDDPELERRLRDEARILGLLHHRAIVGVDRLTRVEGRWAVIMEFVQGEDLSALFARGPMPSSVALAICVEIASAIGAAYSTPGHDGRPLRLLHRDLKPSNVRISPDGSVKVLDFGIARAEFTHREAHTRSHAFGGTEGYMSPERLDGVEDSPAGDVYAVGVILAELLLSKRLGKAYGRPERHMGLVRSILEALAAAGLPPEVVKLTGELLDYEPSARPTVAALERRAEELARRVEGPSLKAWARQNVRVAGLPPPSAPLDTEGVLRSGAILSEGDVRSEQGTIWLAGTDRLLKRHLQEHSQTELRARTPTATLQESPPPPFTLRLPRRPDLTQASPLPWGTDGASLERPAPSPDRAITVERPAGPRDPSAPLKVPPRPQTRRLAVPIVALVVIALALVGAVALTWLEGRRGPGDDPPGPTGGGGEGVGGAGVDDPPKGCAGAEPALRA
jgi:serine/threonine protein kinase